jgi:septum formation protein
MLQLPKPLILASVSPRRAQLLKQVGLQFEIQAAGVEEVYNGQKPVDFAVQISLEKAKAVAHSVENAIILAADTIVLLNDKILGKPKDRTEAVTMLTRLSGRRHEVISGYTLYDRPADKIISNHEETSVWFRDIDQEEIEAYVATGSPLDKAGAYGIQDDFGAVFVRKIDGCYYNVVGLPLAKVYSDLKELISQSSIIK